MKRRSFLELLAAATISGRPAFSQEIAVSAPPKVMLTIAGINADSNPDLLSAVLATLVVGGAPVNLVVDPIGQTGGLRAESEIAQLVARYAASFPGLVEIVAWSPALGTMAPYHAARAAQVARAALSDALWPAARASQVPATFQTIACKAPLDSSSASGALAAGFRCVLALPSATPEFRPAPDATVVARLDRHGVLSLLGGESVPIEEVAALVQSPHPGLQRHLVLSMADFPRLSVEALVEHASAISRAVKQAEVDLTILPMLASDLQMRSEITFRRRIALHVLEPSAEAEASETAAFEAIVDRFLALKIPFSLGPGSASEVNGSDLDVSYWVPLEVPANTTFEPDTPFGTFDEARLAVAQPETLAADDVRFGVVVRPDLNVGSAGLSKDGIYSVPVLALVGASGTGPSELDQIPPGDGLVVIRAASFQTAASRAALVRAVQRSLDQPSIHLTSLPTYCAETLPKDALLPVLFLTRSTQLRKKPKQRVADSEDKEILLEDARSAWGYFANGTMARTGLCPATLIIGQSPIAGHTGVSMWEAGSHINALIAAVDLELVSEEDFTSRVRQLLKTVEQASRKRLPLPPETIDAKTGKGTTRFNSFDTARLLIAMHRLSLHRLGPKGLKDLVASWDFSKVIIDRRLHSYRDRQYISDFKSNYADYAAKGMRLWGFDVASPMDGVAQLASADEEMRLLASTVSFGLLGAEPAFSQLLEMPWSPVPDFLGNCLSEIQSRLAATNGVPAAPSETPLDRSPWFTYQGFDVRDLSDPWAVSFRDLTPENEQSAQTLALRATSTKAAYLWHAARPNRHSAALVSSLRHKARGKFGFDSALYIADQSTTKGYTDLNTNAVILQSVAHILLNKRQRLD